MFILITVLLTRLFSETLCSSRAQTADTVGLTAENFAAAAGYNFEFENNDLNGTEDPITETGEFEGDIVFPDGLDVRSFIKRKQKSEGTNSSIDQESAVRSFLRVWENGEIPYAISKSLNRRERNTLAAAILEFAVNTCIIWKKRTNEQDYVLFEKVELGSGCKSMVGKIGWKQTIQLGPICFRKGILIHEMMHTAGFFHEQSRPDRDNYIRVLTDNIIPEKRDNFDKYSVELIRQLGTEYDCNSIMHYGPTAFSKNGSTLNTIIAKSPNCERMGQREELSLTDIKDLNLLYKCDEKLINFTIGDKLPTKICRELSIQKQRCKTPTMQENCAKTCSSDKVCPATWTKTSTACYKDMGYGRKNKFEAEKLCAKLDKRATLPWFISESEYRIFKKKLSPEGYNIQFWQGIKVYERSWGKVGFLIKDTHGYYCKAPWVAELREQYKNETTYNVHPCVVGSLGNDRLYMYPRCIGNLSTICQIRWDRGSCHVCPPKWTKTSHACYLNVNDSVKRKYVESEAVCKQLDGRATMPWFIDYLEFTNFLQDVKSNFSKSFWLGLTTSRSNDSLFQYRDYQGNYCIAPSSFMVPYKKGLKNQCGYAFYSSMKVPPIDWNLFSSCEDKHDTICQIRLKQKRISCRNCPPKWTATPDICYQSIDDGKKRNYEESENECVKLDRRASLPWFKSREEVVYFSHRETHLNISKQFWLLPKPSTSQFPGFSYKIKDWHGQTCGTHIFDQNMLDPKTEFDKNICLETSSFGGRHLFHHNNCNNDPFTVCQIRLGPHTCSSDICPPKWTRILDVCYRAIDDGTKRNFSESENECKMLDGRATLPWFRNEMDYTNFILKKGLYNEKPFWLGMKTVYNSATPQNMQFQIKDSFGDRCTPPWFSLYDNGVHTQEFGSNTCVQAIMTTNASYDQFNFSINSLRWLETECNSRLLTAICQMRLEPFSCHNCPSKWTKTTDACYLTLDDGVTRNYTESEKECEKLDKRAGLPWFKTSKERTSFVKERHLFHRKQFWLGPRLIRSKVYQVKDLEGKQCEINSILDSHKIKFKGELLQNSCIELNHLNNSAFYTKCDTKLSSTICQIRLKPYVCHSCPPNWTSTIDACYLKIENATKRNYAESEAMCAKFDKRATLPWFKNSEELGNLIRQKDLDNKPQFWLGQNAINSTEGVLFRIRDSYGKYCTLPRSELYHLGLHKYEIGSKGCPMATYLTTGVPKRWDWSNTQCSEKLTTTVCQIRLDTFKCPKV